ncbi:MAG TPA: hypothetical protein VNS55_10700 [Nocardioides sp.]|nr:hypothetical protein [Nocardioides sp.]
MTPEPAPDYTPDTNLADDMAELAHLAEQLAHDLDVVPARSGQVVGADVSWPQCPAGMGIPQRRSAGAPMPLETSEYVVIGLTNGPAFYPNPCLADQVAWATDRKMLVAAYSVISYPDADILQRFGDQGPYDAATRLGRLRNVGYQQAGFNVASMRKVGLVTPIVWLDVEPVSDWEWSRDLGANAAVVEGAARGYRDAGYQTGVYSTPLLWSDIVGDLAFGIPEWRAAGQTSREEALNRCGDDWSIQGGRAVLGQWVEAGRDMNVTCPGIAVNLGGWFHQT